VRIVLSEARYTVKCDLLSERDYALLKLGMFGAAQALKNQCTLRSTYSAAQLKAIVREFPTGFPLID
jgi:hypothetical protein